MMMLLKYMDIG
nr:unnamed protein product [Callosobruchus analis]